ncbi:hypothetical protein GobsT_56120 [Gemmata obscuriglobus]|nr:hypothetical protein [Gemmata obscuriglobus]QEG30799.1 hypothetical protein GobsT_56120 [Gemmata obscuriglobus]VTS10130.1 Uncharacterized protein OS=Singulisphaera acidiphila (strain ATCC BAA-1392 / DSM 18658 / VKM B-2454 / MOB10) GN=Sinac_0577 PE=4 SV=1 [Gemmata obscuriglobus UQM 2246]
MPTATVVRALATLLVFLLGAATATAKDGVKITAAAVGLPSGRDDTFIAKFGAWAPVYVNFEVTGAGSDPAEVVIEAPDPDEVTVTSVVPVDLATDRAAIGYVRPNGLASEVTVWVRAKGGSALSEPFRVKPRVRESLQYVVLALGGTAPKFELPRPAGATDSGPLRAGRVDFTHIATVAQLPDRWYGYDGADLVVLGTGAADFVKQLFAPDATPQNQKKREALVEWVRRGGRVVTSVGANAPVVASLPAMDPLLPFRVRPEAPTRDVSAVALVWPAGEKNSASGTLGGRGGAFPVANLAARPGKPARVLSPPPVANEERPAVVVQAPLGLGRVTQVAFDLDGPQFAEFAARADYWDFLLRDAGASRASSGGDGKPRSAGSMTEDEDEIAVAVRGHNDAFDGVPVVSFGWVALLIALYILLVGPVEYYVLKRVFGRLELTWVTFPIIVLTVSVLAYVSASAVKGRDLKVNKLDIVDVDPASDRVYGSTWFTVFSPRIDSYSVGLTPGDGWAAEELPEGTAVAGFGAPRAGRASLTRRRYPRRDEGLEGVPIQVWSTKAFSANWSAKLTGAPGAPAPVTSNLVHPPGDRSRAIGTFRHDLPVPELTDCVAFYAGQAYPLPGGVITRGRTVRLVMVQGESTQEWLRGNAKLEELLRRVQSYADRPGQKNVERQLQQQTVYTGPLPLTGLLFHEGALRNDEGVVPRNASLRRLDQSWRFSEYHGQHVRDEVIVVGRVATPPGAAEEVLSGPNSPSRVWLKGLPGSGARQPLPGTGRQETWVRFYLPVR